jgi:cell wall assembly regulator SMI1
MTLDDNVARAWGRIEAWLAQNAPPLAAALRPGAGDQLIATAEARMGITLPDAVREAYRVHNGGAFLSFVEDEMLPLEQMASTRAMMNDIGWGSASLPNVGVSLGPVAPMWWNPGWLPFVGRGNMLCIDLDPAAGGTRGQIVEFMKGSDRRTVVFPSIAAWLDHWATALERDTYYFDHDSEELIATPR